MKIKYSIKAFTALNTTELYQILKLRSEVFVVEQHCVYQDIDDKDQDSYHLMCFVSDNLAGYARLLPPGVSYDETSIGRVIIRSNFRGLTLGKRVMANSIVSCKELVESSVIRIGAQMYLKKFYNALGFVETGLPYDEDGILHIEMIKT